MMITDFDIQALIDNELDWEQTKLVMNYVQKDPMGQKRYKELIKQRNNLRLWANHFLKN